MLSALATSATSLFREQECPDKDPCINSWRSLKSKTQQVGIPASCANTQLSRGYIDSGSELTVSSILFRTLCCGWGNSSMETTESQVHSRADGHGCLRAPDFEPPKSH